MRLGYKDINDYDAEVDELELDPTELESLNPMEAAMLDRWDKITVKVTPEEPKRNGGGYTAPSWGYHFICAECADKYGQYNGTGQKQFRECGWCNRNRICKCPTTCGWPDNIEMPKQESATFTPGSFKLKL